jgi:hypothetical protein
MQEAAYPKVKFIRIKYDKLASVANPKHGPQFLEAVNAIHLITAKILSLKILPPIHALFQFNRQFTLLTKLIFIGVPTRGPTWPLRSCKRYQLPLFNQIIEGEHPLIGAIDNVLEGA